MTINVSIEGYTISADSTPHESINKLLHIAFAHKLYNEASSAAGSRVDGYDTMTSEARKAWREANGEQWNALLKSARDAIFAKVQNGELGTRTSSGPRKDPAVTELENEVRKQAEAFVVASLGSSAPKGPKAKKDFIVPMKDGTQLPFHDLVARVAAGAKREQFETAAKRVIAERRRAMERATAGAEAGAMSAESLGI